MQIKTYPEHVIFNLSNNQVKNTLVVLAPFITFGLIFILITCLSILHRIDWGWIFPASFLWASCIWDVVDTLQFVKTGKWNKYDK